jgi:hypothetical protein
LARAGSLSLLFTAFTLPPYLPSSQVPGKRISLSWAKQQDVAFKLVDHSVFVIDALVG